MHRALSSAYWSTRRTASRADPVTATVLVLVPLKRRGFQRRLLHQRRLT